MRSMAIILALAVSTSAVSQEIQRSSSPQGVQVHGNTDLKAVQESAAAVAVGEANTARNSASAIKGNTQIQGNTKVQSEQKNARSMAVGKNNAANNEVGVIGGK